MKIKSTYRFLLLAFCFLILNQRAEAQTLKKNGIHIEFQANYIPLTIKYERSILQTEKLRVNANIGFSHQQSSSFKRFGIPGGINLLTGKKKSHFEFGLNLWMIRRYKPKLPYSENLGQLMIGYRFQNFEKDGLIFRIGIAPSYVDTLDDDTVFSRVEYSSYASFGFTF